MHGQDKACLLQRLPFVPEEQPPFIDGSARTVKILSNVYVPTKARKAVQSITIALRER